MISKGQKNLSAYTVEFLYSGTHRTGDVPDY